MSEQYTDSANLSKPKTVNGALADHCRERLFVEFIASGLLEVDDQGRIWRLLRLGRGPNQKTRPHRKRAEVLENNGYLRVGVNIDSKQVRCLAHRIVWQHFHGDIPSGMVLNHKNGIKHDNHPDNLELVTLSENIRHAINTGLLTHLRGEQHGMSVLTSENVLEIRKRYASGESCASIAKGLGVSAGTVLSAANNLRYSDDKAPKRTQRPFVCKICGTPGFRLRGTKVYCSLKCQILARPSNVGKRGDGQCISRD